MLHLVLGLSYTIKNGEQVVDNLPNLTHPRHAKYAVINSFNYLLLIFLLQNTTKGFVD